MWSLESERAWELPLRDHLAQLLDAVQKKGEAVTQLAQDGFQLDIFCPVEVLNGQGCPA